MLSKPGTYPNYEALPRYSVFQRRYSAVEPRVLEFNVSISPNAAVSGTAMLRLACRFHEQFANESGVEVLIFDDERAAKSLALYADDQEHHEELLWHLRGRYLMDRDKNIEFVEFAFPRVSDDFLVLDRYKTWIDKSR